MRLPEELRAAIDLETAKVERKALARAVAELTESYKAAAPSRTIIRSEAHRAAYLAVRLPATYAACHRVFDEIVRLAPEVGVASVLDLGAGPGTALWAAAECFPNARQATLVESDAAWVKVGRRIAAKSPHAILRHAEVRTEDLSTADLKRHDLAVLSYVLGELRQAHAVSLLQRAWSSTEQFLAIIEPGTPGGFANIHAARQALIAAGAEILAPCPNRLACPMAAAGDWCHFSQRVERTSLHRQLKGGALAYEDEKFSYLVASQRIASPGLARIVRHPFKNPGHLRLTLCAEGRIEARVVTRSQKEAYKRARRAAWGDTWEG